jgi:hypothetical protein
LHRAIQSKRLKTEKKKEKKNKGIRHGLIFFFLHKKYQKMLSLRVLGLSAKIYPKTLGLAATLDSRILFIILIITLNLHDLSLSEPGCNIGP